jgi:hypothetical protein
MSKTLRGGLYFAFLFAMALTGTACEGPVGPEGPRGPAGPTGPQGPAGPSAPAGAVRVSFLGQLGADGTAVADLPLAAGTVSNPPAFLCYLAYSSSGNPTSSTSGDVWWVRVGDDLFARTTQTCVMATGPNPPALRVAVAGGAPFQGVMVQVAY